ncbi:restriction endonuclease subunit S [Aeribacillus sp. FSL K6-2833]|uniref:restriction endonuclease subunit S n=1 Tax=Aeribacillus sp. FSL K6-2833 TaxID=2954611 RepID=UPI0030D9C606
MSKKKQKSMEELLEEALVPEEEQPYKVPENWVWTRLGKLIELVYGKSLPEKKRSGNGFPVYGSNGVVGYHSEFLIEGPVIIVGRKGSYGEVNWYNESGWAIDTTYYVLAKQKINYKYVYYLLKTLNLKKLNRSTAIPGLNREDAYTQKVVLPPFKEQKRIVEKIEQLFAKIDEAKRLIEEVKGSFEPRRAAILDRAFGGRLGTNDPKEKSMFETFNELTEKDLIPKEEQPYEVPKNWVWIRLGSFLPPMETRDLARLESENFLYVDIDSIDNNKFEIREPKIIEIKNAPSRAKRRIDKGDVIISLVRPYLRNVARVLFDDPRLVASTAFYVCKRNKVTETNYLYYYLITSFVTNYLNVRTKGHNAPSVRNSDFLELPIPIPPVEEQKRIAEKVDILLSKLETEKEMVLEVEQKLNSLKQSILYKAFRGELGTNNPTDEHAIELLKEVLKSK